MTKSLRDEVLHKPGVSVHSQMEAGGGPDSDRSVDQGRVLAAYMNPNEAQAFAGSIAASPSEFLARWATTANALADRTREYVPPKIEPMPASAEEHVATIRNHPLFANYYAKGTFCMVEIGRVLSLQHWVDVDFCNERFKKKDEGTPADRELLDMCLPPTILPTPNTRVQFNESGVTYSSRDTGLHIEGITDGKTGELRLFPRSNANLLLVRRFNGKLGLGNGHHRAFALRRRGVVMVPAIIMDVASPADFYLPNAMRPDVVEGKHPPTIDDFLDDELCVTARVQALMKIARVSWDLYVMSQIA